jgi:hypothetical protein
MLGAQNSRWTGASYNRAAGGVAIDPRWDNLVAGWHLDEVSGTRADVLGTYDLTDNNTVGVQLAGPSGVVANFVAANSEYLSRANASAANLRFGDSFSFSLWFNPTGHAESQMLVAKDYDVTRGYAVYYDTNQKIQFQLSATGGGLNTGVVSSNTAVDNAWNFVVVEYNSSTDDASITLNGVTTTTAQGAATDESAAEFDIGREAYPGFPFYATAQIARVGAWSSVLGTTLRNSLFNLGAGKSYASLTDAEKVGLVSYWNLDEVSGNRADSHGSNTLTDNNTVTSVVNDPPPPFNAAASFVAANSEYLSVADPAATWGEDGAGATVSLWWKPNGVPASYGMLFGRDSLDDEDRTFNVYVDGAGSQNIFMEFNSGSRIQTTGSNFTDAAWNHLVVTFDPTDKKQRAYLNGSLVLTSSAGAASSLLSPAATVVIGGWPTLSGWLNGAEDEVYVFNAVKDATWVTDMYNAGLGRVYPN